jgi:hypothetical protein
VVSPLTPLSFRSCAKAALVCLLVAVTLCFGSHYENHCYRADEQQNGLFHLSSGLIDVSSSCRDLSTDICLL